MMSKTQRRPSTRARRRSGLKQHNTLKRRKKQKNNNRGSILLMRRSILLIHMGRVAWATTLLLALAAYADSAAGGVTSIWGATRGDALLSVLILIFLTAAYARLAAWHIGILCQEAGSALVFIGRRFVLIADRPNH